MVGTHKSNHPSGRVFAAKRMLQRGIVGKIRLIATSYSLQVGANPTSSQLITEAATSGAGTLTIKEENTTSMIGSAGSLKKDGYGKAHRRHL